MAEDFKDVYRSRGFHRVKGEHPPDWNTFVSFSSSPDFSDLRDVLVLSSDEIAEYSHQKEDLILQCTFDEQECDLRYILEIICILFYVVFNCWYQNKNKNKNKNKKQKRSSCNRSPASSLINSKQLC